ncbi:MAG: hypothetical protein AMXMBFR80_02980 [Dehalococcoidia bacterium]
MTRQALATESRPLFSTSPRMAKYAITAANIRPISRATTITWGEGWNTPWGPSWGADCDGMR